HTAVRRCAVRTISTQNCACPSRSPSLTAFRRYRNAKYVPSRSSSVSGTATGGASSALRRSSRQSPSRASSLDSTRRACGNRPGPGGTAVSCFFQSAARAARSSV
ncbi:Phage holin, partial [Dysosmobacter welbionis]